MGINIEKHNIGFIKAKGKPQGNDIVLAGWVLPGCRLTEDREEAVRANDIITGSGGKKKTESRFKKWRGMAGPYAIPLYK